MPWLRNATNDAELRAAIDVAYDELDGSAGSPLGGTEAAWFFEQGLPHSRYESYIVRSFARLGAPLAADANESAFVNAGDRRSLQRARMLDRFLRPAEVVLRLRAEEEGGVVLHRGELGLTAVELSEMPLLAALPDDVATDQQDDREREVEEDLEALILQRLLHLDR